MEIFEVIKIIARAMEAWELYANARINKHICTKVFIA